MNGEDDQMQEASASLVMQAERLQRHLEQRGEALKRMSDRFNAFFGVVLVLNAVKLGVDVSVDIQYMTSFDLHKYGSLSLVWFLLDFLFLFLFSTELVLRVPLMYQIRVKQEEGMVFGFLPGIITSWTASEFCSVLAYTPTALKEPLLIFDCVTVFLNFLDCLVLRFNVTTQGGALKIISIARLLRLARLAHLIPALTSLVNGFLINVQLVARVLGMLLGTVYLFAILVVQNIGQAAPLDSAVYLMFGRLGDAMFSLSYLITYSGWGNMVAEVADFVDYAWYVYPVVLVLLAVCSLNMLNLITGVMVQASFTVLMKANLSKQGIKLSTKFLLLESVDNMFYKIQRHLDHEKHRLERRILQVKLDAFEASLKKEEDEKQKEKATPSEHQGAEDHMEDGESREVKVYREFVESEKRRELLGTSSHNQQNSCEVFRVLWVSDHEVAIDFELNEDLESSAKQDPRHSVVKWEGGVSRAKHVIAMREPPNKDGECHELRRRTLVFRDIPWERVLKFRYGLIFSDLVVIPEKPFGVQFPAKQKLEDLEPLEHGSVTVRELNFLLEDPDFVDKIGSIGLRADQALIVYHKLTAMGTGAVKEDDFIEALLRMKRPVQGVDIATAKSCMRRLLAEILQLNKDVSRCKTCFQTVTEKLREAKIQTPEELGGVEAEEAANPRKNRELELKDQIQQVKYMNASWIVRIEKKKKELKLKHHFYKGVMLDAAAPSWE